MRVARRDFDKARRVPGELVAEMARAGVAARGAWLQAREANDFAPFAPYLERNIELRRRYSACFPEAEHPYDPLLDDYEPGMTHGRGARGARAPARRPRAARGVGAPRSTTACCGSGRSPRPASARCSAPCCARSASTSEQWRLDEATHPFEATIATTDVRLTTRYDEADLDSLYCVAARVRPRPLRAPGRPRPRAHAARRRRLERLARVAEPAVGEHGRPLGRLLALVPARTRRPRCPSASPA